MDKYDYDKVTAAKALGIGLSSLYRKIEQLGIDVDAGSVKGRRYRANIPVAIPEDGDARKLPAG